MRVYPRLHGGNSGQVDGTHKVTGLSPPTRGKRAATAASFPFPRSIPAYTGETFALSGMAGLHGVYPRLHGGNRFNLNLARIGGGLSPPTRGKPFQRFALRASQGSIPAYTGETR